MVTYLILIALLSAAMAILQQRYRWQPQITAIIFFVIIVCFMLLPAGPFALLYLAVGTLADPASTRFYGFVGYLLVHFVVAYLMFNGIRQFETKWYKPYLLWAGGVVLFGILHLPVIVEAVTTTFNH